MPTQVTTSESVSNTTISPPDPNLTMPVASNNNTTKESADLSHDVAQKISNLPQFAPDWSNRRKLIFNSVYFCGGVVALITATVCIGMLMGYFRTSQSPIDHGLTDLAETIVYSMTFFASSIIGAYCFGTVFEIGAYRKNVTDMATNIATSGRNDDRDRRNG